MQNSNMTGDKRSSPLHYPPMPVQVHLSDYLAILKRWKWTMMLLFMLIVGGTTLISFRMSPMYRATAQVMIEKQPSLYLDLKAQKTAGVRDKEFYQTQYNLLQSKSLASVVIEKLAIAKQFNLQSSSARNLIGSDALASLYKTPDKNNSSWLIDWYLAHLRITPLRGTHLVNIGFQSHNPKLATSIANTHAEEAMKQSVEIKKSAAEEAFAWLIKELDIQKKEVETAQRAIYEYKKENNIISLEGRQNVIDQHLIELSSALTRAEADRMAKQTVFSQLRTYSVDDEKLYALPEMARDPIIGGLRNKIFGMKAKKLEMATRYGPKHPKMIELTSGIHQLNREIESEVKTGGKNHSHGVEPGYGI